MLLSPPSLAPKAFENFNDRRGRDIKLSDARRTGHRGALITADACARLGPQVKYEMTEEVISCFAPDCLLQCERVKGVVGGGVGQIPPPM